MGSLVPLDEAVTAVESGMTVGIGGWGARRKPMALVRALCRSAVTDLTVVSYGGPDVGLLCAAGKVRRVVAPFVTMDTIALEPHFRRARQAGSVEFTEYDEGMFMFGLYAAAHRLPYLPTPVGVGSDVLRVNPGLRTVTSPYGDGGELVAVPALEMDVALVHMDYADERGNGLYAGGDPYMDDLYAKAAAYTVLSCEELVPSAELLDHGPVQALLVSRLHVAAVVHTPGGAHPTTSGPRDRRDEAFQSHYAKAAADDTAWGEFRDRFLSGDEAAYQDAVTAWRGDR